MKKILIIEDNEDHALLIKRALGDAEVSVVHYSDGPSAIAALTSAVPADLPQLVLIDLKLPGMDGFEILSKIRANHSIRQLPAVILTTSAQPKEIRRAYELGASGYVVKSDDYETFNLKLQRIRDYWLSTAEFPPGLNEEMGTL